ncbi:hypothetical protein LOTGIDRAFT_139345 [Lottia gigantea]|uniref:G-protein coupled receptors family 1 profile domain-containing protein n=1 Tax=Lottia gigantea TaxID=225164 RepID=V4AW52_LOTGI|nr:hypothetical protein LOTGIDRAFT_139345 [Lottia gigantea]ESP01663.1 hypothetical protein LOTGIDRAFT_139345 [Lottia gigantea]
MDIGFTPICSTLGILGNILSMIVMLMNKKSTSYQYLAMIAVTDVLVLILNIMFMARKFPGHEIFHEGTCGLIFFLMYFSIHYNVALLVTMTLERFVAIKYPLHAQNWFTIRRARIVIIVEGILAFAFDFHNFFTRKMITDEDTGLEMCSQEGELNIFFIRKVWPWFDAVVYCYLPLTCLFTLNILIIREVRQAGHNQRQLTKSNSTGGEENKQTTEKKNQERQITIMLLLVSFCFLIFVSPMAVIIVVERYYWIPTEPHDKAVYHLVRTITNHMMYLNHSLNFLLYFISGRRFRDQFRAVFCKCLKDQNKTSRPNLYKIEDGNKAKNQPLAVIAQSTSSVDSGIKNNSFISSQNTLSSSVRPESSLSETAPEVHISSSPEELPPPPLT